MNQTFGEALRGFFRKNYFKPDQVAKSTGIPKDTILNWLKGRVTKPRSWKDVVTLAGALHLDEDDANQLLSAATYPAIAELRKSASSDELHLFIPWKKGNAYIPTQYQEVQAVEEMDPAVRGSRISLLPADRITPKVVKITSPFEMEFARVPKGPFLMGSRPENPLAWPNEKPQHQVIISQDYWIGCNLVTNAQFLFFVEATNHCHEWVDGWQDKLDHPVVNILWEEAVAFCEWLNASKPAGLPDGCIVRLPTEAEWKKLPGVRLVVNGPGATHLCRSTVIRLKVDLGLPHLLVAMPRMA